MRNSALLPSVLDPAPRGVSLPGLRYVLVWSIGWAIVGCIVAGVIVFSSPRVDLAPALRQSVLFAEVVGFSVLISTRLVFPLFGRFPALLRLLLQVLTLFAGALFGSLAAIAADPLFALARPQFAITVALVNSMVAVVVGIALYTYDSMRRQIEASYRVLREKEALERELAIAREVQRELLPRNVPRVRGLELAGVCLPAVGVGGDYYDFLPFDEDRLGVVIADVSGKGIPAALLMAGLQSAVRSIAVPSMSAGDVTSRLNQMLCRSSSASRYATLLFGFYDGRSRTLRYANAGHHPALVLQQHDTVRLAERGMPIGLFDDRTYKDGECTLSPGDLVVMFTDGVVEAPGVNGEEFGEQRLVDLLRPRRTAPLDDIVANVLDELARWTGGGASHDDVTLVLARAG